MEPGAIVRGTTTRLEAEAAPAAPSPAAQLGERALDWFRTLVGLAAFGLVLVLLFPSFMQRSTEALVQAPWASLGLGFALLVGVPVAAVLLFVAGLLVGGWWLGLLALALYFLMLPIGCAIVGLFVGRLVMQRAGRPGVASGWSLLASLALLGVVSLVPIAGGIAILAALTFGLGAGTLAPSAPCDESRADSKLSGRSDWSVHPSSGCSSGRGWSGATGSTTPTETRSADRNLPSQPSDPGL